MINSLLINSFICQRFGNNITINFYKMRNAITPLIVILVVFETSHLVSGQNEASRILGCYYNSRSFYREGLSFQPSDIDQSLCTHIIYDGIGMKEDRNFVYSKNPELDLGPEEEEPNPDEEENSVGNFDLIRKTVALRESYPNLKILVSVGGLEQSSRSFSNMARHIANRTVFIRSVMEYVDRFELDGIDFNWAYPGMNGGRPEDIETFVVIVKELKIAFANLTTFTGRPYVLTTALRCTEEVIDAGYDTVQLAEHVDHFHLHCYDLRTWSESNPFMYHHSPLYFKESDSDANIKLSMAYIVNHILEKGTPANKLVLSVASHSRTFEIEVESEPNIGSFASGFGRPGRYTNTPSLLAYYEICGELKENGTDGWQFRYDHIYKIPYMSKQKLWIGYDNEISAKEKVDFILSHGMGGAFVTSIDLDDYSNMCDGWNPYPITNAIKERLNIERQ